ncbi:GNAT family N-acetyltransferase [Bacillus sp. RO3]|nr:GNAT family N-acetyltransferase [Bacillus sp. RO3]
MKFTLRKRTTDDINEFMTWTYEGIYSFYDNNIQQEKIDGLKESIHDERAFSVTDEKGHLVGNCEFFDVEEDGEKIVAVGVQMSPSLTGKGHGSAFVHDIVEQGRDRLGFTRLGLAVVDFNERAIRTYEKEGFIRKGEFQNDIRGTAYSFIIMEKDWA